MWDIVICDHDLAKAKELGEKVEDLPISRPHRVHLFTKGQDLLDEIAERRIEPVLVIMDLHIGEEDGVELAAQIRKLRGASQIIFMSEIGAYPKDIYDVDHIFFLLKPVSMDALRKAVAIGVSRLDRIKEECLYICNKSGDFVIPLDEICSLEKEKRKIVVYTVSGVACSFYGKFEEIEAQLKQTFIRCHHSFVVNMYRVKMMVKDHFILWDGRKVPISRTYAKQVRQQFEAYASAAYDRLKTCDGDRLP